MRILLDQGLLRSSAAMWRDGGLVRAVLAQCGEDLGRGAVVSVTDDRIRVRNLPLRTPR